MKDPFTWVDNVNLTVGNFNFNFFQKYKKLRLTALVLSMIALTAWVVFGFDSCIGQPMHVLMNLPNLITGQMTVDQLVWVWNDLYGKEFHYSAVVIYGLLFYFLSRHYEDKGLTGSRNIAYAMGLSLFSIGIFELYWMGSFAFFQGQAWVIKPQFPQLRIILQNLLLFMLGGGIIILHMWVESHVFDKNDDPVGRFWRFRWNWISYLLIGASIISAVVWWYYPFGHVETFTVTYETGEVWTNSVLFPQTLYTVDVNPHDDVNAGVWFWKENNAVHAWNTVVKTLFAVAVGYIGLIKMEGGDKAKNDI